MFPSYQPVSGAFRTVVAATALVVALAAPVAAQDGATSAGASAAPATDAGFLLGAGEWSVAGVAGWGVPIFNYGIDNAFAFPSVSWARVLTRPGGHGLLRGQFQWGVEVIPLFTQFTPDRTYGVGVSPLLWRWNFEPRGHAAPFAELGGGVLWTNRDLPPETTRANYMVHVTLGVRMLGARSRGPTIGYRFEHISNGNRANTNPSVNAHAVVVGWSMFRGR